MSHRERRHSADERFKRMGDIALRLLPVLMHIAGIKMTHSHHLPAEPIDEDAADLSRLVAIGFVGAWITELTTNKMEVCMGELGIEQTLKLWTHIIDDANISAQELAEFRDFISK